MRTVLASLVICASTPAFAGPDFVTPSPQPRALAASEGTRELMPQDDVVFRHDSAALTAADRAQVATVARWLRAHREAHIVLEGYADHTGDVLYNEDLATRRAQVVRQALIARGIKSHRIVLTVFGESGSDPRGNPLDRRVIMHASELPVRELVATWIAKKRPLSATWSEGRALFIERPGIRFSRGGVATR
jgi:outer membrane protein OmpA-like peptidoglycan-associated protein